GRPVLGEGVDRRFRLVPDDTLMAVTHQPAGDIAAHPTQTDHAKLHLVRSRAKVTITRSCSANALPDVALQPSDGSGERALDRLRQMVQSAFDVVAEIDPHE